MTKNVVVDNIKITKLLGTDVILRGDLVDKKLMKNVFFEC